MLTLDGSMGEGGGQILRSSLALSLATGTPFRLEQIRAGRRKPGLMRQHLTAVRAASAIGAARVDGAELGSRAITFAPGRVRGGDYRFAVGTAGSATLVLQTVLPALLTAAEPSRLELEGGTHNPFAPPFDFLDRAFLPLVSRMGPKVTAELERPGFYPAGGGRFRVTVEPTDRLRPLELTARGALKGKRARAYVALLPAAIGHRELRRVKETLSWSRDELEVVTIRDSAGPGNALVLQIESEHVTEVFTGFGDRNVSSEQVADDAVNPARRYLATDAPVGTYLADQLLVPLALAGGGVFRTLRPSRHTRTNVDVVQRFLDLKVELIQEDDTHRIEVRSRGD